MVRLAGNVCLISGGLGGIGRVIAKAMIEAGAAVAIGDVHEPEESEPVLCALRQAGRKVHYHKTDVSDPDAVAAWVKIVEGELDVPDMIVPCAAIVSMESLHSITPISWQATLDTNLSGVFYVAHTCATRLIELGRPGRIVLIGSWAGHRPHAHIPAYCVAKAGIRMLCQVMAATYAESGILVNEVAPGFVDTSFGTPSDIGIQLDEMRALVPTNTICRPEEVAAQVLHLCDENVMQITGSTIVVDGGLSLTSSVNPPQSKRR